MDMEVEGEVEATEEVELSGADCGTEEAEVSQEGSETIVLRAEDLESGPRRINPRFKKKQYPQRYRREWESLDFNQGWMMVSNVLFLFYCMP